MNAISFSEPREDDTAQRLLYKIAKRIFNFSPAPPTPPTPPTPPVPPVPVCQSSFIAAIPAPVSRNNFTGCLGFQFKVASSISVARFGRYFIAQNTHNHRIDLWDVAAHVLPIATGTVLAASASDADGFKWVDITPITLDPAKTYRIAVAETNTEDMWKDEWNANTLPVINTAVFTTSASVFGAGVPGTYPANTAGATTIFTTPAMCFFIL